MATLYRFRRLVWTLTAIYWLILLTATHLPPSELPKTHVNDKIEHITAFGLLSGALFLSLWPSRRSTLAIALTIVPIVLTYGALDELTQPLTGRTCDIHDWLADASGCLIAVVLMSVLRKSGSPKQMPSQNTQSD